MTKSVTIEFDNEKQAKQFQLVIETWKDIVKQCNEIEGSPMRYVVMNSISSLFGHMKELISDGHYLIDQELKQKWSDIVTDPDYRACWPEIFNGEGDINV